MVADGDVRVDDLDEGSTARSTVEECCRSCGAIGSLRKEEIRRRGKGRWQGQIGELVR